MGPSRSALASLVLLTFLAGGAAGVLFDRHILQRSRENPEFTRSGATHRQDQIDAIKHAGIELTPDQEARIHKLITDLRGYYITRVQPHQKIFHAKYRAGVLEILTAEQRPLYEKMVADLDARRRAYYESAGDAGAAPSAPGGAPPAPDAPEPPK
jgi:Spy/CpxP family protein refolding chaperone